MAKYRVKKGHEGAVVCTQAPFYRKGNGRFELAKCTQRDLKYLFEVVKHPAIESANDEQERQAESPRED